jgi:putative transposase
MRLIDEQYTRTPFYGSPKMTQWLRRQKGEMVNHKRVERLMRQMGLMALSPGPHTRRKRQKHRVYPYLLNGLDIVRPDQVWATDITYIRMQRGFLYLVAIMDLFSRYVLSWCLSNTLDTRFCLEALEMALGTSIPDIFNADQGVQFTSEAFTDRLENAGVTISMAGRGRCFDNILVERLWRTLKYEEIYLNDYTGGREAEQGIARYFRFYHQERPHQSLGNKTPKELYYGTY